VSSSGRRIVAGSPLSAVAYTTPADAVDDAFDDLETALDVAPTSSARRRTTTRMPAVRRP
jgi:hypothetical protein